MLGSVETERFGLGPTRKAFFPYVQTGHGAEQVHQVDRAGGADVVTGENGDRRGTHPDLLLVPCRGGDGFLGAEEHLHFDVFGFVLGAFVVAGGLAGAGMAATLEGVIGTWGTAVVLLALAVLAISLIGGWSLGQMARFVATRTGPALSATGKWLAGLFRLAPEAERRGADEGPRPNLYDQDADGFTACMGDCDDGDAGMNTDDLDGDGVDTCGGDCDDDPEVYPC